MNPTTDQLPPPPPQLPLQPPRSSFSCDRHPDENFSGFCPLCLCERLHTLDQSANPTAVASSSSRRNSTSSATTTTAAVIKSLFKLPSSSNENSKNKNKNLEFIPELRRTKSFSASKNEGLLGVFEPQRKSCDVRGRSTLCSLFSIDDKDENKPRLLFAKQQITVPESKEEEEEEEEEVQICTDQDDPHVNNSEHNIVEQSNEIEELEETTEEEEELKTMQDHIDLDSHSKKPDFRSNFWSAASNLGKKWQKWRRKPKKSEYSNGNGVVSSSRLPVEKPISRQYRETKSEIADYGFGRRSCDIDPRFSLDAGRISYDDPRHSFDEPRASWDGYIIGRTFPRLPPMVEDVPVVPVPHSDMQVSVEQPGITDEAIPGGSIQTREYYTDSSSKRRKSLDRSNSIRKMAAAVVAEMDETKAMAATPVSNAKVSPATIDYSYGNLGMRFPSIGGERELARDSNASSLIDDCSETFELGLRDNVGDKKDGKKSRRWRWKLWGFIHRRGGDRNDEENGFGRGNGVERSYSESWQETGMNNRLFRSNSTVSWRNGSYSKKSNCEVNGKGRRIGGDEFVLERNRSAKYSPNHADSGLLRFYLTPLRGSRRSKPISNSNPVSRNMNRVH
ncbi:putative protein OCTOPUS [Helianthus annuus]|uniref:Uncharacterized protein n=1 Tax=Helianthus annuus TaxID=4232 RepID=A0A251U4F3_HELAN|nr:putative protein OCTOPUS [Helianthus annuus]KAJ0459949.1 putative protein OCTOPUS [Helianthus annuus]